MRQNALDNLLGTGLRRLASIHRTLAGDAVNRERNFYKGRFTSKTSQGTLALKFIAGPMSATRYREMLPDDCFTAIVREALAEIRRIIPPPTFRIAVFSTKGQPDRFELEAVLAKNEAGQAVLSLPLDGQYMTALDKSLGWWCNKPPTSKPKAKAKRYKHPIAFDVGQLAALDRCRQSLGIHTRVDLLRHAVQLLDQLIPYRITYSLEVGPTDLSQRRLLILLQGGTTARRRSCHYQLAFYQEHEDALKRIESALGLNIQQTVDLALRVLDNLTQLIDKQGMVTITPKSPDAIPITIHVTSA